MYRSATKSDILDQMTFIQNGVDAIRRNATMAVSKTNNGESFVDLENKDESKIGGIYYFGGDLNFIKASNYALYLHWLNF